MLKRTSHGREVELALTGSFSKSQNGGSQPQQAGGQHSPPTPPEGRGQCSCLLGVSTLTWSLLPPMSPLWACSPGDPGEGTGEENQARGQESKIPAPQPLSPPPRRRLLAAGESPSLPHALPSPRGRANSTAACIRRGETWYTEVCKRDKSGRSFLGGFGWGWGGGGERSVMPSTSTCLSSTRTCD